MARTPLQSSKSQVWLALHALVVLLPALGALAHAPDVRLYGSEAPPELPTFTAAGWKSEQVQPAFLAWFEAHIGFRGVMVRTDSTAQVLLSGEAKPAGVVVIGKSDTLFLKDDLWFMGKRPRDLPFVAAKIDVLTSRLGSVQRKLEARGKKLVVIIAPSKTAVYPEAVPAGWRRPDRRSDEDVHAALRTGLERNGVAFADGHAMLENRSGADRERLFPRTGRHWTTLGACLVLREALRGGSVTPSCSYEIVAADWTEVVDFDLYRLLNLWRGRESARLPAMKESGKPDPSTAARRPRTLFVGTSFMWMLADVMRPYVDAPIAFYYNNMVYDVSESLRPIEPVDPASPRWPGYALERDLYVIELLETYSHGEQLLQFVETLDERLE